VTRRALVPRLLPVLLAAAAPIALSWRTGNASQVSRPAGLATGQATSSATGSELPTLAIEARRELVQQADRFVTSTVFQPPGESLPRWNTPVCPLVQGLPSEFNEFIQAHIRQIARSAGVPVAAKHCAASVYVFATDHPDLLLKNLLARNPRMFDTRHGLGSAQRFLHSQRPVRVWYNTEVRCRAAADSPSLGTDSSMVAGPVSTRSSYFCSGGDTRLSYAAVSSLFDEYIVVDMNRMTKVTTRQLADYLAMIGLADVRLDPDTGTVPTILRLFERVKAAPEGLSRWDRALLYALYNTSQASVLQVSEIETTVAERVARPGFRGHAPVRAAKSANPLWVDEVLPQRGAKAIYWYHIAADQHDAAAEYDLALRYFLGQGVPQSYVKAAQWYREAGDRGDRDAQYNLGVMYANGEGVPQSDAKAAQWYLKAAQQGYAEAQFNVGFMYASGQGLPQDFAKAARWYRKAAEQGHVKAQNNLGIMYLRGQGVPRDYAGAVRWLGKAAEQGDAGAQESLGLAYAKGEGVPRNYAEASQWFRKAAEQGNADAQFDLGVMYASGHGVRRDPVSAYKWWVLAKADSSLTGDAYDWSANRMKESASRMTAEQVARARREAAEWLAAHRAAR
jgi:uncharacterized protein